MFTDPCRLIDETVDNLQTLAVLFADEVDERIRHAGQTEPTVQLYREAWFNIQALVPKLQAARVTQCPQRHARVCVECDD